MKIMGLRKPNIVLVPGAFSFASTYSRLLEKLTTLEYAAEVLELPSAGSSPPLKGPDDDVAALQSLLSSNVEQGNEVVLVCHSYGGIVASNAVEEFTLARRREAGKEGGVILVIYMAAFALPKGQSLFNLLGGEPQHWMIVEVRKCSRAWQDEVIVLLQVGKARRICADVYEHRMVLSKPTLLKTLGLTICLLRMLLNFSRK